jgi:hypothetical protein
MWRVDAYQIPYYSRGIEGEKRTHPRFADWPRPYYDSSHWNYFRKSYLLYWIFPKVVPRNTDEVWWRYGISRSCDEWDEVWWRYGISRSCDECYSRCAMFDWSDTVFRRRNVTRRRISNTVLQPRYWGREADSPEVCRLSSIDCWTPSSQYFRSGL